MGGQTIESSKPAHPLLALPAAYGTPCAANFDGRDLVVPRPAATNPQMRQIGNILVDDQPLASVANVGVSGSAAIADNADRRYTIAPITGPAEIGNLGPGIEALDTSAVV